MARCISVMEAIVRDSRFQRTSGSWTVVPRHCTTSTSHCVSVEKAISLQRSYGFGLLADWLAGVTRRRPSQSLTVKLKTGTSAKEIDYTSLCLNAGSFDYSLAHNQAQSGLVCEQVVDASLSLHANSSWHLITRSSHEHCWIHAW